MTDRRELTADERAKPYAKYYYAPSALPAPAHAALLADLRPLDPAKADRIQEADSLLLLGYTEGENGYTVLPDGSGYVALCHYLPGATPEMFEWWFAWHALEDLRYKIWFPESHVSARVDDATRAKILDPNRSLAQKFQGLTHHVVEDIGGGVLNAVKISFLTPEDFGFDMALFHSPNVEALAAANVWARRLEADAAAPPGPDRDEAANEPALPVAFAHLVRSVAGGIEVRNRFWMGYQIVGKRPVLSLPPGAGVPEAAARGLFLHDVQEFANLAAILPSLFAEQRGKVE